MASEISLTLPQRPSGMRFSLVGNSPSSIFFASRVHPLRPADRARRDDVGCYAQGAVLDGDLGGEGVDAGFGDGRVRL